MWEVKGLVFVSGVSCRITEASNTLASRCKLVWRFRGVLLCSCTAAGVQGSFSTCEGQGCLLLLTWVSDLNLGQHLVQLGQKWCCLFQKALSVLVTSLPWCGLPGLLYSPHPVPPFRLDKFCNLMNFQFSHLLNKYNIYYRIVVRMIHDNVKSLAQFLAFNKRFCFFF